MIRRCRRLTRVFHAVPSTFFSALRNSAEARVWDSSARSFPTASLWREKAVLSPFQRSLRSLPPLLGLRPATKRAIPLGTPAALLPQISKLVPSEKPCPLSRPRTSSPTPFAFIIKKLRALEEHLGKAKPETSLLHLRILFTKATSKKYILYNRTALLKCRVSA